MHTLNFQNKLNQLIAWIIIFGVNLGITSHILAQSDLDQDSSDSDNSAETNRGVPNTDFPENVPNDAPNGILTPQRNVTQSSDENPFSPSVVPGTPRRTIPSDILKTLKQINDFQTLISILELADLNSELEKPGFLVLFAPTEEAFDRLETELYDRLILPENRSQLIEFLKNHLVIGEISQDDLERGEIQTLSGTSVQVQLDSNGEVKLNGATAKKGEFIRTQNGLIVPINQVLFPPNLFVNPTSP